MKPTMTEEERILTLEEKVARLQYDVYALQSKIDLMTDRKDELSKIIIEAYSRGFEDGAEAVKAMPQTFTADGIVFAKMDEPQTERSSK